ncbi:MAG: hypothetical protein JKY31_00270 [Rhodobacteraceae bacterium]|nr:hypothetical protein [Paracoccaceae bacterium]
MNLDFDLPMVHVAGVIRFSYPCDGGFKRKYDSADAKRADLYSLERLDNRFHLFEALCLHTLKRQTDKNFSLGILVGEDLPRHYYNRMMDNLADFPEAKLISLPMMSHREAVTRAFNTLYDQDMPFRFGFRLDDDDAVSVNFVEQLHANIPSLLLRSAGKTPIALSFPKGVTIAGGAGDRSLYPAVFATPPSAGLAVLTNANWPETIYRLPHHKIQTQVCTVMDPRELMYLRVIHSDNDSEHSIPNLTIGMPDKILQQQVQRQFGLSVTQLKAL